MQEQRMGIGLAGSGTTNPFEGDFYVTAVHHDLFNRFLVDGDDVNKLRANDKIVRVNNFPVYGNTHKQVLELIRFLRSNSSSFKVLVKRQFSPSDYLSKLNHFVVSVNIDLDSQYPGFSLVCQHFDPDNPCILPAIASVSESNSQLMPDDVVTHLDEECLIGLSLNEIRCLIGVIIGEKAKNHDNSLKLHVYRKVLQPNFNRSFIYMRSTPDQLYSKYKLSALTIVKGDAFQRYPLRFFDTRWRFVRDEPQIMVFYERSRRVFNADYNITSAEGNDKSVRVDGCNMVVSVDGCNCFDWSPDHFERYMDEHASVSIVYIRNLKPSEITDIHYYVIKSYSEFFGYFQKNDLIKNCGEKRLTIARFKPVKQMYVKALTSYDSSNDRMNPGVGLSYDKYEVVCCLNGSDKSWWKCAKIIYNKEKNMYEACEEQVGIVPSQEEMVVKNIKKSKRVSFGNAPTVNVMNSVHFDGPKPQKKKRVNGVNSSNKTKDVMDLDLDLDIDKNKSEYEGERRDTLKSCMRGEKSHLPESSVNKTFYVEMKQVALTEDNKCRPIIFCGSLKTPVMKKLIEDQEFVCEAANFKVTNTNGVSSNNTMTLSQMMSEHSIGKAFVMKREGKVYSVMTCDDFVEKSRKGVHILIEYDEGIDIDGMVKSGIYPLLVEVTDKEEENQKIASNITAAVINDELNVLAAKVVELIKNEADKKTIFIKNVNNDL